MKKKQKTPIVVSKKQSRYILTLCLMFIIGALVAGTGVLLLRNNNPTVLVWAADKEVKVPDGLVSYLERKHATDCQDYKGTGSVTGVATFAVFESYQNRFAKMTYGCGPDLTKQGDGYIVAYRDGISWKLTRPTSYFISSSPDTEGDLPTVLPSCQILSENDFPASFEPICATEDGEVLSR